MGGSAAAAARAAPQAKGQQRWQCIIGAAFDSRCGPRPNQGNAPPSIDRHTAARQGWTSQSAAVAAAFGLSFAPRQCVVRCVA
jgi:hypothetical protein